MSEAPSAPSPSPTPDLSESASVLVPIAVALLRAAIDAEKLEGEQRAEAERQAMILAQRSFYIAQARRDFKTG